LANNVFQVKILSDSGSDLQNTSKNTPPKFFPREIGVARILDRKTATFGVKNRLKSTKNHQKLVPVLGFGWKLIRKGKEHIKKGFPCISEA